MQQITTSRNRSVYFANLDGFRFLSFLAVFFYHAYLSFLRPLSEHFNSIFFVSRLIFQNGYLGVNFFFVLSGFLITYLLVEEKLSTSTIQVGNFYLRRILRIWPLFYLCIFIGFFALPAWNAHKGIVVPERADLFAYLVFLANFDAIRIYPVEPSGLLLVVLWSICVEEQFYLVWPWVVRIVRSNRLPFVFVAVIAVSLIFRTVFNECSPSAEAIRYFHTLSLIGDMAIGALFAHLCLLSVKFKIYVTNLSTTTIAWIYIIAICVCFFRQYIFVCGPAIILERLVVGSLFALIIVEQNFSKHSFFKMGRLKLISRLGRYTYGLYCLHLLAISIIFKVLTEVKGLNNPVLEILAIPVSLLLATAIAYLSYQIFEKWFLRIKSKLEVIKTSR